MKEKCVTLCVLLPEGIYSLLCMGLLHGYYRHHACYGISGAIRGLICMLVLATVVEVIIRARSWISQKFEGKESKRSRLRGF